MILAKGYEYLNAAVKVVSQVKPKLKSNIKFRSNYKIPESILPEDISVIIPVKNNKAGIDRLLESIRQHVDKEHYPREIIIIDNNSDHPITISDSWPFQVSVIKCTKPGPAAARNYGVANATGKWLLFTDSDCVFTPRLISGYLGEANRCIAYNGLVTVLGDDYLSKYYREQNVLHPSIIASREGELEEVWCLVTANCLVLKEAFEIVGGFNDSFVYAGGEDTDLGLRLSYIGIIHMNYRSVAIHHFEDGIVGFVNRFIRYGRGNRKLEDIYDGHFWPEYFLPNKKSLMNRLLARISVMAMRWGFRNS